jgi:membrane protein DedA with SNARE-associated domain
VTPVAAIPITAVVIAGYIAGATWPSLLDDHPLLLLALSPTNRNLLLTTNVLDAWAYFGVGLIRHLFPDPFFFLLGWWYGDRAVQWVAEAYPIVRRIVPAQDSALDNDRLRRFMVPLALLAPNNWVSLLAGSTRLRPGLFVTLNVAGTVGRLMLCRWLGRVFASEIRGIADWIARYQGRLTLLMFALVVMGIVLQMRRGSGELIALSTLGDELDGDEDE